MGEGGEQGRFQDWRYLDDVVAVSLVVVIITMMAVKASISPRCPEGKDEHTATSAPVSFGRLDERKGKHLSALYGGSRMARRTK